jgi:hypothetical protein
MATRSAHTRARRLGLGLAALVAAALLAASGPVSPLGPDTAAACQTTSSSCGG